MAKYTGLYVYEYIRKSKSRPNSKRPILYGLQHESPAVLFIVQQYSSARFISLRFYPAKRNSALVENIVLLHFPLYFFNLQLPKPRSVCRSLCLSYRLCWLRQFVLNALFNYAVNPLNAELNPICYLLALLAHHFLHVSRIRVKSLILRLLMSYIYIYIYMERLFLMFLDHTQRRTTVGRTPLDE